MRVRVSVCRRGALGLKVLSSAVLDAKHCVMSGKKNDTGIARYGSKRLVTHPPDIIMKF